jgi:hypothetical protein
MSNPVVRSLREWNLAVMHHIMGLSQEVADMPAQRASEVNIASCKGPGGLVSVDASRSRIR